MLQAELKILGGKHQGKLIPLTSKKFLVGREQDCHLRPNSDLVSRHHCVFSIDDYAIRLRDLGSTNGTMVNGTNVRGEVSLKAGDRVTIGKLELEIVIRQAAKQASPIASLTPPPKAASVPPSVSTAEIPTQSEEVETSYELAVFAPPATPDVVPADTAIIGNAAAQQYPMPEQYPMPGAPGFTPGYPQMIPPAYPMSGGYMPPQYPQYPTGYGQPPGYGQPMGYPMGYPQMMPMQQAYPVAAAVAAPPVMAAAAAPAPEAPVPANASAGEMAVRLPNPAETGANLAPPPGSTGAGAGAGGKKEEKPSNTAADIIKQYMNRRS